MGITMRLSHSFLLASRAPRASLSLSTINGHIGFRQTLQNFSVTVTLAKDRSRFEHMLQKMIRLTQCGVVVLLMTSLVGAAPYSKYGRTCKDIGCLSSEICVMNEDPCTTYSSNQCGRYPSCKKNTEAGEQTCASMICPSGQYCRTDNGRPTCVNTVPGLGYDSAGVSTVNGQPSQTNVNRESPSIVPSNTNYPQNPQSQNPYANANAPPIPSPGQNYPVNSGTNLGYPAYPSNSGSNGYPPNPSINTGSASGGTNLGYPPYPTNNRMPVPGQTYPQSNYPAQNYPGYPQQNPSVVNPGYPHQNNYPQQYPGYQNYPPYQNRGYNNYNNNNGYRKKNGGSIATPTVSLLLISFVMLAKYFS